ncbi:MAG: hypothetical protein WA993_14485 [Candidatus Binatus sp.]|jgi:hypothetical protein|uniref:hypothetical protein n=1 Tax=Candidatus Binatus sp. TaxID=2811406 RepID=UPI003CC35C9B
MRLIRLAMALAVTALVVSTNCWASDFGSLREPDFDLLTPAPHQFDIEAEDTYQFLVGANTLRRRIDSFPDSAISLQNDLGVSQMQLPEVLLSYWFDSVNAAQFQFRYFGLYGSKYETQPLAFGGSIISPNQELNPGGDRWYTFGGYYERRLTPLYQNCEQGLPVFLQGWDTRAKIGLEFTYNDFRINDGSPNFSQRSLYEARIRFHEKGLPIPVIGIEERRWLAPTVAFEVTAQGYWANKWDSGRSEGGTVYDSQSGFETHWRVVYSNRDWRGFSPFAGLSYYYSKYTQTSSGVGNLLRVQMIGPELGFNWSI